MPPGAPTSMTQREPSPGAVAVRAPSAAGAPASGSELERARARLQGLGAALVVVWVFLGLQHRQLAATWGDLYPPGTLPGMFTFPELVVYDTALTFAGLLLAVALIGYARWGGADLVRLGRVGLAYGVLTGVIISAAETVITLAPGLHPGVPAITPWVLLFPMLVPARPATAATVAVLTAATTPLGMVIVDAYGTPLPDLPRFLQWTTPTLILAAITYLPLRMIDRTRQRAEAAETLAAKLGSYELVEPLGRGGMGEVWRARHLRLARPAAIKLIRPGRLRGGQETSGSVTARFEREAEATATLQSPHTVSVYDFGVTAGGELYLVMELLVGEDLSSLVKRTGAMQPGRVVHLLQQACRSLAEAHERGLIHRDIKPANLICCTYALEADFLKVLDFGLVKQHSPAGDQELTADGSITGTPAFMPPEMATDQASVDARADLYSLGCVAWYLLTADLVFDVDSPVRALLAHVGEQPDVERLRALQPIPAPLESLILQCLSKAPDDRPASARELELRLEAVKPALGEPWTQARARQWWKDHPPGRERDDLAALDATTDALAATVASDE